MNFKHLRKKKKRELISIPREIIQNLKSKNNSHGIRTLSLAMTESNLREPTFGTMRSGFDILQRWHFHGAILGFTHKDIFSTMGRSGCPSIFMTSNPLYYVDGSADACIVRT